MTKTPDLIEPFVGWKGLLADSAGSLYSPAVTTPWPARKRLVAKCIAVTRSSGSAHVPPLKSCSCGIYAVKTFEDLKEHGYNMWEAGAYRVSSKSGTQIWVVARVSLWGDVIEGQIGYRAQYAYPKKIYVPGSALKLGALIRERYGVQLGIIDRYTGRRS